MEIELRYFVSGYLFCMCSDMIFSVITLILEKAREIRQRRKNGN